MSKQSVHDVCRDASEEHAAVRSYAQRFGRGGDADADIEAWLSERSTSGNGVSITKPDQHPQN